MKTGSRVICIDASAKSYRQPPPLIKGREYIIYGVKKCTCGNDKFDVGLRSDCTITRCINCGSVIDNHDGIHWANSKRFAKVQEQYRTVKLEMEIEEPIYN